MAGGGIRGGTVHGSTDEFGFRVASDQAHVHDLHATILHLMGLDHEALTYFHSGRFATEAEDKASYWAEAERLARLKEADEAFREYCDKERPILILAIYQHFFFETFVLRLFLVVQITRLEPM